MVKETRIIFSLEDLTAVRARCGDCGGEVVYPCDWSIPFPEACPLCRRPWTRRRGEESIEGDFLRTLRLLLCHENEAVKLRLEMPSQPDAETAGV